MTNVSVTNPEEQLIKFYSALIAKGKLQDLFKLITEHLPTTSIAMAVDPGIKLLVKTLNNFKCKCCHTPIKANVHYVPSTDTYSVTVQCPQCGRIKTLNSPKPKYWLLDLREKMNKTVEEVASATGLHPRTIEKAEQHFGMIESPAIAKIIRFYGVPLESIHLEPYQAFTTN